MKKIIGLLVGIMLFTACSAAKEDVNEDVNSDAGKSSGDETVNLKIEKPSITSNSEVPVAIKIPVAAKTPVVAKTSVVSETNYYTLEVVDTDLTPREWLDASYKEYSGKWIWDFKPMIFAYQDENNPYEGFLAYRNEAGMYVEYRLVPLNGKLFVFRREGIMPDMTTVEGQQEEKLRVAELVGKIKNYKAQ